MQAHDNKQHIRKDIAALKKRLSEEKSVELSQKICDRLIKTDFFQKAGCIALYYAMDDEVRTSDLIDKWCEKKKIALPVICGENINFHEFKGKEFLSVSASGISEPDSTEAISPEEIDLFVVPGVAFDHECNRLGRGKGFYDKYMADVKKPMIGICFDFQLIETIPAEKHDIKMSMIITENVILSPHRQ